jgi:hypothetical protein
MIQFPEWRGRFGNQLFQYVFGRILNVKSGRTVRFPSRFSIDLWLPESVSGTEFEGDPIDYRVEHSGFDWSILERPRPIRIRGGFEDFEYYAPYRAQIRSWLPLPPLPELSHDEIVVHMRCTDFREHQSIHWSKADQAWRTSTSCSTPIDLLCHSVESFGLGRPVRIVTDDLDDPDVGFLARKYQALLVHDTPESDFLTICAAKNVVMSASTFSWWATFLGNPARVVCPLWNGSPWHLGLRGCDGFPRLTVFDDPRFEYPTWHPVWMLEEDQSEDLRS